MTTPSPAAANPSADAPTWAPAPQLDVAEDVSAVEAAPAAVSKPQLRARARRPNSTSALLVIGALIAFGGVGFAVGHATSSAQTDTATTQNGDLAQFGPNASGLPGGAGLRGGFGSAATVTGTVVSVAADSITVKLSTGETVTIATGSATAYHNQTAGSSTDLAAGQTVQVQTSGGANAGPNASASPGAQTTRTATDVTITSK